MALFHPLGKGLSMEFSLCWAWMRLDATVSVGNLPQGISQPVGSVPPRRAISSDSSSGC